MAKKAEPALASGALLIELRGLIEAARQHVAQTANATQTMLYWHVGQRVQREVLKNERAEYGEQIVSTLSTQLVAEYGQAFGPRSLRRMMQFADVFPNEKIVSALAPTLSWSHFIEILPLKQPLEREYYAELCRVERWSVRTLRERIASQLYLRTAIAKQPDAVVKAEISHVTARTLLGSASHPIRWCSGRHVPMSFRRIRALMVCGTRVCARATTPPVSSWRRCDWRRCAGAGRGSER
ncbi:MAG: hypothetical protein RL014_1359 [Pseudomonadota bacterium]